MEISIRIWQPFCFQILCVQDVVPSKVESYHLWCTELRSQQSRMPRKQIYRKGVAQRSGLAEEQKTNNNHWHAVAWRAFVQNAVACKEIRLHHTIKDITKTLHSFSTDRQQKWRDCAVDSLVHNNFILESLYHLIRYGSKDWLKQKDTQVHHQCEEILLDFTLSALSHAWQPFLFFFVRVQIASHHVSKLS